MCTASRFIQMSLLVGGVATLLQGANPKHLEVSLKSQSSQTAGAFEVEAGIPLEGEFALSNAGEKPLRVSTVQVVGFSRVEVMGQGGVLDLVLNPGDRVVVPVRIETRDVVSDLSTIFQLHVGEVGESGAGRYINVELPLKRVGGLAVSTPSLHLAVGPGKDSEQVFETTWTGPNAKGGSMLSAEVLDPAAPIRVMPVEGAVSRGRRMFKVVLDPAGDGPHAGSTEILVRQGQGKGTTLQVFYQR